MSMQLLRKFEQANDAIAALVERDILALFASLGSAGVEVVREALFELVPGLIAQYGDIAATVAADFYDELRAAEGVPGSFRAPLAPLVPTEVVHARLGYATRSTGPLYSGSLDTLAKFTALIANGYAMQPGRDTIMQAARKERIAFARIPEPGACDFCIMVASRGFDYGSEEAALRVVGTLGSKQKQKIGEKFHDYCKCIVLPAWDETRARVEYGYDEKALYDRYIANTEAAAAKKAAKADK